MRLVGLAWSDVGIAWLGLLGLACGLMSVLAWSGVGLLGPISTDLLCFSGGWLRWRWV